MKTILRMTLITVLLFNSIFTSKSQNFVLIPDANFATYLKGLIPSAVKGNSLNIASNLVATETKSINVGGQSIKDLSGIQYFTSLIWLDCSHAGLTSIPALPNSLQFLDCGSNNLTNLPALPNSLTTLNCYFNFLSDLPKLPNSLINLNCQFNSITNLSTLPIALDMLQCQYNQLSTFPTFPNSLTYIDFTSNPYKCLPNYVLPAMKSFTATPLCGK
jgi:hypothetical protein